MSLLALLAHFSFLFLVSFSLGAIIALSHLYLWQHHYHELWHTFHTTLMGSDYSTTSLILLHVTFHIFHSLPQHFSLLSYSWVLGFRLNEVARIFRDSHSPKHAL